MSFFENQDRARRNTLVLIMLFIAAVTVILLAVTGVIYLLNGFHQPLPGFGYWLTTPAGMTSAAIVLAIIAGGSIRRYRELAEGGASVAEMAGARAIDPDTSDADEQRLRRIAEEMAIASGTSVPRLYVMDQEPGINAFVAGYHPTEAAMVVTRGMLENLGRDQLKGVVAHEFSHILNGDMRLNIRLIALLGGILAIGQLGQALVSTATRSVSRHHYRDWRRSNRNNELALLIPGIALMLVGYVGLFCGRLVKSAVSRQREYLADAAAVQFTRNPEGIASALYRINLNPTGSRLSSSRRTEDLNHMCFGQAISLPFQSLLASHPPIEARLQAIDPSLPALMRARYGRPGAQTSAQAERASPPGAAVGFTAPQHNSAKPRQREPDVSGSLSPEAGDYASQFLARLPGGIEQQLHSLSGAVHWCLALALEHADHDGISKAVERMSTIGNVEPDELALRRLIQLLHDEGPAWRLPLLEIALPALRQLSPQGRRQLLRTMRSVMRHSGRVDLSGAAVLGLLQRHLKADAGRRQKVRFRRYSAVMPEIRILLWVIARAASDDDHPAPQLYQDAMSGFETPPRYPETPSVSVRQLFEALQRLAALSPMLKPALLQASVHCAKRNQQISTREYELLRIVADQLDSPLPPVHCVTSVTDVTTGQHAPNSP